MPKAKQEGQAAFESPRGERAALRNLTNVARVLESNPAPMPDGRAPRFQLYRSGSGEEGDQRRTSAKARAALP